MQNQDFDEFEIKLTLKFRIPKEGVIISVLYTVTKNLKEIGTVIAKALLAGLEEKAIEEKLNAAPGYVRNGRQSRERQIKASFGSFSYRCARLYDRVTSRINLSLRSQNNLPRPHRSFGGQVQ